jgi:uncharacterized lipoprotein YbaY
MRRWTSILALLLLGGCALTPDSKPETKTVQGTLTFREMTALPDTATAHVIVAPALPGADSKPVAEGDFPARTGTAIPFKLEVPAAKVANGGEYLVIAQVVDHGKVWFSNLSAPLRISFLAEPGDLTIELRKERF